MCATYAYIDHQNHPNVGINGSPMECLGIYIYYIMFFVGGLSHYQGPVDDDGSVAGLQ